MKIVVVAAILNVAFFIKFLGYLRAFPKTVSPPSAGLLPSLALSLALATPCPHLPPPPSRAQGFFVRMLLEIGNDLMDFMLISALLLVSFSMAFYMLFSRVNAPDNAYLDDDDHKNRMDTLDQLNYVEANFGTYVQSLITTYLMLLGDWDPELMRGIASDNGELSRVSASKKGERLPFSTA